MPRSLRTVSRGMCLVALAVVSGWFASSRAADKPADTRVFEMRTYIALDGRLDALHKRFREHTCKLFEKHGMELIGFWTPTEGPEAKNTLVYILAFPSREAREKAFEAFRNDPDWIAARDASEKDGKIVEKVISQFLAPTDYSKIK